jgi:hypothetical protein
VIAWFPRDPSEAALDRWPDLADYLEDPDAYCRAIEVRLREMHAATGRAPSVGPLNVEALLEFASEEGLDPNTSSPRSQFAAVIGGRGEAAPWPPGGTTPAGAARDATKRCCA